MANFGPLTAQVGLPVSGTPPNFNGFRVLASLLQRVPATSLTGGQPNFARSLAVSWAGTLYIRFWGLLRPDKFCPVQSSLCVQVLRSPILTALLHSTPATGVSQTLRRGTRNGTTELLQRALPVFGWAAITLGIGPHSSLIGVSTQGATWHLYSDSP